MGKGAGHGHALLLAARQLSRVVVSSVAQPYAGQQLRRPWTPILTPQLEGHLDVLPGGEGGDEVE